MAATMAVTAMKITRDGGQPGDELAVDHVVAVDGLGQQARQRPLRPLAVDGVEAEGDAQQRAEEADERR